MIERAEKTFSFGDFELNGAKRLLLKQGETLALNPKTFDLLLTLVENRGQILSKDELLEKVWEGQFVEENNLTVHISAESLAASRTIKDLRQIILSCHAVAGLELRESNLAAARKLYEESLVISRELKDERQIAFSLSGLSNVLLNEGNGSAARPLLEEALIISRRMGFKFNLSTDLINLGAVDYYESVAEAAYRHFSESLTIAREIKSTAYISCCLDGFAAVAAISKIPEQSARLAGAAESLRESIGYEIETTERLFRDDYLAKTRSALDEKTFFALYEQGKTMNLEQAMALAKSVDPEFVYGFNDGEAEISIENHSFPRIIIEEEFEN